MAYEQPPEQVPEAPGELPELPTVVELAGYQVTDDPRAEYLAAKQQLAAKVNRPGLRAQKIARLAVHYTQTVVEQEAGRLKPYPPDDFPPDPTAIGWLISKFVEQNGLSTARQLQTQEIENVTTALEASWGNGLHIRGIRGIVGVLERLLERPADTIPGYGEPNARPIPSQSVNA